MFGSNPDRPPIPYDPEAAKKLLTEAGYPDGFEITLGTPNDRYINDEKIAQAVAQMWTRIGVKTAVDAKTASAFFADRNGLKFSAYLAGWGAGTGEMSSPLSALVATPDPDSGLGATNKSRYSNPQMDDLLREALATVDDEKRESLLQEASRAVMDDYGIIPIHYEMTTWAMKNDIDYVPRADQYTLGYAVTMAK
jgi:peptide/nickel transport system substrate-binding protein